MGFSLFGITFGGEVDLIDKYNRYVDVCDETNAVRTQEEAREKGDLYVERLTLMSELAHEGVLDFSQPRSVEEEEEPQSSGGFWSRLFG